MRKLFIGISLMFFIMSCSDDVNSNENNHISIATVENPTLSTTFNFRLDDGSLMQTNTAGLLNYKPKDGQRIIANYNFIETTSAATIYTVSQNVKLNDVYEILTKRIFKIKPTQQDSIGNDQIEIRNIWIGSDYLNVEFVYPGYNKAHFISLISDDTKTYTDGKVHLEFRHNANGDYPSSSKWGLASFDLKTLKANHNPTDSVKLIIHTKEYGNAIDKTYPLTYKFGVQSVVLYDTKVSFPLKLDSRIH